MPKAKRGQKVTHPKVKGTGTIRAINRGTAQVVWGNGKVSNVHTTSLAPAKKGCFGCGLFLLLAATIPTTAGVYYLM